MCGFRPALGMEAGASSGAVIDLTGLLPDRRSEVLDVAFVQSVPDRVELVVGADEGRVEPELAGEHPLAVEQGLGFADFDCGERAVESGGDRSNISACNVAETHLSVAPTTR